MIFGFGLTHKMNKISGFWGGGLKSSKYVMYYILLGAEGLQDEVRDG